MCVAHIFTLVVSNGYFACSLSTEGMFSKYKMHNCADPGVAKLKPLVLKGWKHDANECTALQEKGLKPTEHQERAFSILSAITMAANAKKAKTAKKKQDDARKRIENEREEVATGVRTLPHDQGVHVPHGASANPAVAGSFQHLCRQPSARRQNASGKINNLCFISLDSA